MIEIKLTLKQRKLMGKPEKEKKEHRSMHGLSATHQNKRKI